MNDKLTIVLFLRGREAFTLRWLEYMESVKCPFRILIADGSEDDYIAQHLETANYPNIIYKYQRFPYDETLHDFYAKACATVHAVETEYMVFSDNDDFMSMDGLSAHVHFLDMHTDYVSCGGPTVFFESQNSNALLRSEDVLFSLGGAGAVNDASAPLRRVLAGIAGYDCYLWYNVVRAHAVSEIMTVLKELDPTCIFLSEYLYVSMIPLFGKTTRSCERAYYRQLGTSQADNNSAMNYNTFFIVTDEYWSREFTKAHEMVHARFNGILNVEYEDFLRLARESFASLLNELATPSSKPLYTQIGERLGLRETRLWKSGRKMYADYMHYREKKARIRASKAIVKSDTIAKAIAGFMSKNSE